MAFSFSSPSAGATKALGNAWSSKSFAAVLATSLSFGFFALMVSISGYQRPAPSIWPEANAETTVDGSIGTFSMSVSDIPAFSRARPSTIAPEVPSGTPTFLPLRSFMEVIPGWAMTRSARPGVLTATIRALPEAGSQEQGLKSEYSTFTNGPLQIQALGSGNLDFGYIGPGAMCRTTSRPSIR